MSSKCPFSFYLPLLDLQTFSLGKVMVREMAWKSSCSLYKYCLILINVNIYLFWLASDNCIHCLLFMSLVKWSESFSSFGLFNLNGLNSLAWVSNIFACFCLWECLIKLSVTSLFFIWIVSFENLLDSKMCLRVWAILTFTFSTSFWISSKVIVLFWFILSFD